MEKYPKNKSELKIFSLKTVIENTNINQNNIERILSISDKVYEYLGGDNYNNEEDSQFLGLIDTLATTVISKLNDMPDEENMPDITQDEIKDINASTEEKQKKTRAKQDKPLKTE